jgi:endonuclease/exonuclease/phosphatase family metal-dependent hydrolase
LRITTWNVGMALGRKLTALESLAADIAVLQEVSRDDIMRGGGCWAGNLPSKGLGVMAAPGWSLAVHPAWDRRIEFIVPIEVHGPVDFLLFATWVMHARAVERYPESPNRWQMLQALDVYAPLFRGGCCVVAGDFNNAVRWDKPGRVSNHAEAVSRLEDLGLISAYHESRGCNQGCEPDPTLYWTWNRDLGYHIDFVWLPRTWSASVTAVEIGSYDAWVAARLSDHLPITVELDSERVRLSE